MSCFEEESTNYEEQMFDKPRGQRRWLGKHHHRGKERLHNEVKDRTFIEKVVVSVEPLSKKAAQKIEASMKDELEFNVLYSLDKKDRWRESDTVKLLGNAPEDVNVDVMERNILEQYKPGSRSTFAVYSRKINEGDAPGEFYVRIAKSSGRGQDCSNFLPSSRELSKKANARMMKNSEEEEVDRTPTVTYNIYKAHRSQEVVGRQMFKDTFVSKPTRHRANQKIEIDDYEEEDYFDEEDDLASEEFSRKEQLPLDLASFVIETRDKQNRRNKRKDSEMSYVIVGHEALEPEAGFTGLMDIPTFIKEEGSTFEDVDVTFHNQKDNFPHQMDQLRQDNNLKVKDLRPNQCLVDVSNWCKPHGKMEGETTTVIVFTHLQKNQYNVIVNSTIASHPLKRGSQYLRSQISSASTIQEAISRITTELLTNRRTIDSMKFSSEFYGRKTVPEMLHNAEEWDNQMLEMQWPRLHHHATWANSKELSTVGGRLEWEDICAMVKKESSRKTTCYSLGETCGVCSLQKRSHELFLVEDEAKVKCTECLRNEFYRELRARRVPIDLQTETADELEYLPTFIPLTVLNLYIRMVSEMIYKDIGAAGSFEKCPSCKSAIYFEDVPDEKEKKTQNRSCPCGYSWCRHCDRAPHWPMECKEYIDWEEKWFLRYSVMKAQGDGTESLLQITCSCSTSIYNVLIPTEFCRCPGCNVYVNMHTMNTVWDNYYFPYQPRFRKQVEQGHYVISKFYNHSYYVPRAKTVTDLAKIPGIRASVIEICGAARDVRYDLNARNRAFSREHALIRKGVLETETVENLMGTAVYLTETVTAWMHVKNQYDRDVKNTLKSLMDGRKELMELLGGEDREPILECIRKLRRDIDSVVSAVENKLDTANDVQ